MREIVNQWASRPAGFWRGTQTPADDHPTASPLGSLVWAPGVLSRNGVRYLRCRAWRADTRTNDMVALKRLKVELPQNVVDKIADDVADLALTLYGARFFNEVVPVACGHSRRTNCLSARLALAVTERVGGLMVRAFKDRFVNGVSHPKEFSKLPPLEIAVAPQGRVLVVDDVATSGFHMHEAVTTLRNLGIATTGLVWLSGTKQS